MYSGTFQQKAVYCVCMPTSKLVTARGYCSLLVLRLFSSTWCTPHKQGPSGAHKEDKVCRVFHCSQPQCGTLMHLECMPVHREGLLRPCPDIILHEYTSTHLSHSATEQGGLLQGHEHLKCNCLTREVHGSCTDHRFTCVSCKTCSDKW